MLDSNRPFTNGRDSDSLPSFVLSVGNVAKFNATFAGGETVRIPLKQTDMYALFLPEGGRNFLVSAVTPVPIPPAAINGGDMVTADVVQNPAVINLGESLMKSGQGGNNEFYLLSPEPQVITVLVYSGGN